MWADLVTPIAPFIDDVSRSMEAQAEGFDPEIVEFARYALINQGKRLRPVLLGSCGRLFGGLTESHTLAATIVEMVHLATLVHDDVMDEADMRRSRPTVRSQWGNEVSVLLGDCFFAQALALASEFPTTTVCRLVSRATRQVCSGEIIQNLQRDSVVPNKERYFNILGKKTAELFAVACELGAHVSGATEDEQRAVRDFGYEFGVAYQIYDDCLDLFGREEEAGKSLRSDYYKSKATLPILIALERASGPELEELLTALREPNEAHWRIVSQAMDRYGALQGALEALRDRVSRASLALGEGRWRGDAAPLERLLAFLGQKADEMLVVDA